MEAPEKQAGPHLYSFYYHSLVTHNNNTGILSALTSPEQISVCQDANFAD